MEETYKKILYGVGQNLRPLGCNGWISILERPFSSVDVETM
jgi:hypothetical protein